MAVQSFDHEAALAQCAQGNETVFQELYRHEAPRIMALAVKILGQADAEDVVRDAFILIWKNADSFNPQSGSARAWLYSIVRYRIQYKLRQTSRPVSLPGKSMSVSREFLNNLHAGSAPLARCMAELDESQRMPILMAYYHGMNYDQIAASLGKSVPQVRAKVRAGLQELTTVETA